MRTDASASADALKDAARLEALQATALLDGLPEESFDRFTRLATRALGVPVCLITLIDADRQFFVSQVGLPEPLATRRQSPLSLSLCKQVVTEGAPLIVTDARTDERVHGHPAVHGLGVTAYAGVPLTTPEGHALGSLCAIDDAPRGWTDEELSTLHDIAAMVMSEIGLRAALRTSEEHRAEVEEAASSIRTLHGALDAADAERVAARGDALRIAAELAHELRTPLYAIRMLAEDVAAEAPAMLQEDLARIETTTGDALEVIEHQLDLARTSAGHGLVRVGAVEIPRLFRALRAMLAPLSRPAEVTLRFELDDALPVLRTDGLKLAQILRNLATNALRHTRAGEVCVRAALDAGGERVVFTVRDTGTGIAPEDQGRVFGRYEQVAGPQQTAGAGLGLPLAQRMAGMIGGEITVVSAVGEGSTFTLVVPVALGDAVPTPASSPRRPDRPPT